MKRPPLLDMDKVAEWWVLKIYFETKDRKRLTRLRDEFTRDMQINFITGKVTKATSAFDEFAHCDEHFKQFKESDMMKELAKEPQSRDETKMDEILPLFKHLRFCK